MDVKKELFDSISNCKRCEAQNPFHFRMKNQKIMLISLCPTYSALYKPLYSIKFFREVCLALFGDVEPSEKLIKEFYDSERGHIYWTHYYKCFMPDAFKNSEKLNPSDKCESFLKSEIELLNPDIIIILGKETVNKLFRYTLKDNDVLTENELSGLKSYFQGRKLFCTDFPSRGNFERFEKIRIALKEHISWINVVLQKPLSFAIEEYMELEYESLLYMNTGNFSKNISETDREWIEKIIFPNLNAYNVAVQTFVFIESSIKGLLMDRLKVENNRNIVAQLRIEYKMNSKSSKLNGDICEIIKKPWLDYFKQIADFALSCNETTYNYVIGKNSSKSLIDNIRSLAKLRNIIAHSGGTTINTITKFNDGDIEGVYTYGNAIFISKEGVENILKIGNDFMKLFNIVCDNI